MEKCCHGSPVPLCGACRTPEQDRKLFGLRANVDRSKSWREAEVQFTARERLMIRKLEMIATGRTADSDPAIDLEIARDLAAEALDEIGWPSVRHMQRQ